MYAMIKAKSNTNAIISDIVIIPVTRLTPWANKLATGHHQP
jgi:hypothetical protein